MRNQHPRSSNPGGVAIRVHFGIERPFEELKLSTVTSEELLEAIAVNLQVTTEYRIRLAEAAQDEGVSVEEFVLAALERALRPVESRREGAARDILELEALWRSGPGSSDGGAGI